MHSPLDVVTELIAKSQAAQKSGHDLLIYLTESLVEVQHVLNSDEYDAEKLAEVQVYVRTMLRKIAHAVEP